MEIKNDNFQISYGNKSISFFLPNINDHIQKQILNTKTFYEIDVLEEIGRFPLSQGIICDIGANIGNHTLYFSKILNREVFAFEPIEEARNILQHNLILNKIEDKIRVFPFALGAENAKGEMDINTDNLGASRLHISTDGNIEIRTLDDILDKTISVSLLKIDVEGFEVDVLKGAKNTILMYKPLIIVEAQTQQDFLSISSILNDYEYQPVTQKGATATVFFIHSLLWEKLKNSSWPTYLLHNDIDSSWRSVQTQGNKLANTVDSMLITVRHMDKLIVNNTNTNDHIRETLAESQNVLNETVEKSSASTIEKLESIERVVKEDLNLLYDENRRIEENLTRTESNISDAVEKSAIKVVEHLDGFETTLKDEMVVLQKGNDHIRETLAESQNVLNETVEKSSASTIEKLESIERVVKEDLNLLYDENRRMKVDLQTTIVETVERSNLAVKYELNTLIDSSKQINEFLLSRESQLNSTISKMQKKIEILNEQKAFSEKKYREIFENIEQIQKSKKKFQRLHSDVIQREQKIKNHLSYRIGYAIVSNLKSPLNWIKIPYAIFQAFQAFKLNNNAPESAYIDLITQNPNDCIIMPMSKWQVFQIPSYNSAIFLSLLSFDKSDYIELEWSIQKNNDILEQNVTNFSSDNVKRIPIQESDNHDCQLLLRKCSGKPCLIKIHSKPMLLEVNDNIQKPSVVHEQITTIGENESLPAPTLSIVPYMQRLKEFGKTLEIVYTGEPLISVIMTSYNTEDYIAAAIESILNQTWISLELIVVDDCSTDQSRIVIENIMKNDKRVKLYCFGENRGTYWCKNYGITKAQGDIITFMDSDDVSLPDRLSLQFQELNHPDRVMVTCNLIRKNLEGDILSINGITERIAPISKMVKKSVFDDIGYFDTLRTSADDEFMQRIRLAYGRNAHANVQQVLYHALVRDESLTMEAGNAIDLTAKREAGKSFLPPARQNYLESYQLWHKTLAEQGMIPYMPFPVVSRAFPVYGKLVVSRGQYDGNTISICMASFPPREEVMKQTVLSLIDQVDYIYVYLNNYIAIPDCLDHPRIKVTLGINADGDLRDNGKLYFMQNIADGYCFFVDDDIAYPADYVQQLIRKIEFYDRKAVVGIHGTIFAKPFESYFKGRTLYHFRDELQRDAVVNQLGTGTVGFHTGLIRPNLKHFSETGMADVFFAIEMKKNNIPLICIERKKGWLQPINVNVADGANLFEEFRNNDHKQTQLISENGPFDEMISNELGETLRANEQKYGLSFASHSIDISILRL